VLAEVAELAHGPPAGEYRGSQPGRDQHGDHWSALPASSWATSCCCPQSAHRCAVGVPDLSHAVSPHAATTPGRPFTDPTMGRSGTTWQIVGSSKSSTA